MSNEIISKADPIPLSLLEKVLINGDLSGLTPSERLNYYQATCKSLNLNPLTRPFEYVELSGKLTFYVKKDGTEQLRKSNKISVTITAREKIGDVYVVTARGETSDGRYDEATGAVSLVKEDGEWATAKNGKNYFKKNGKITPLPPDELANAFMKAETKAKRRLTLSIVGLGMLDESELETVSDAKVITEADLQKAEAEKQLHQQKLQSALSFIENAATLEVLKQAFDQAQKEFKKDRVAISQITNKKDTRKKELLSTVIEPEAPALTAEQQAGINEFFGENTSNLTQGAVYEATTL
jgi:hypothetical protein